MAKRDVVVIGASAGGVETLRELAAALPPSLPASIFVVVHFPPGTPSALPRILTRHGPLPAEHPRDGAPFEQGRIYVAPPDLHLLVKRGATRLVRGPRENASRPAVDPLFRTAARAYGPRVLALVLSGNLDDGTAGLAYVKRWGGLAAAQDPDDALFGGMPRSAIAHVDVDRVLTLAEMPAFLEEAVRMNVHDDTDDDLRARGADDPDVTELAAALRAEEVREGAPSTFTCPECHGALWEVRDGEITRYRCRTGHAYNVETLFAHQGEAMEAALWTALTALEERAAMARRMVERMGDRGHPAIAARYAEQVAETEQRAELLRRALLMGRGELAERRAVRAGD